MKIYEPFSNNYSMRNSNKKSSKIVSSSNLSEQEKNAINITQIKDSLYLSQSYLDNFVTTDKGTANDTTIEVSKDEFFDILNACISDNETWRELGIDNEKRWIVIDGQRFECGLTDEEKFDETIKRDPILNFIKLLNENDKKHAENRKLIRKKEIEEEYLNKKYNTPTIAFDPNDKAWRILKKAKIC